MFGQNRQQLRQMYHDVWQKKQANESLSALESMISQVISEHPEYHKIFNNEASLEQEYFVEDGQTNPFLHMGLHITIQEQIGADRPMGIRELYEIGLERQGDPHMLEHRIMECLGEVLWRAQRDKTMPDEAAYLGDVRRVVGFM